MARDIMKSRVGPGKRAHVPQVHPRTGEPRQIVGDGTGHVSHGVQADHVMNTKVFLGKPPKFKAGGGHAVPIHPGMTFRDSSGVHVNASASQTQVSEALRGFNDPTVPAPREKQLAPVKAAFSQRSRISNFADPTLRALSRAALDEACRMDPCHPRHFK
jgi:hypothetical protein